MISPIPGYELLSSFATTGAAISSAPLTLPVHDVDLIGRPHAFFEVGPACVGAPLFVGWWCDTQPSAASLALDIWLGPVRAATFTLASMTPVQFNNTDGFAEGYRESPQWLGRVHPNTGFGYNAQNVLFGSMWLSGSSTTKTGLPISSAPVLGIGVIGQTVPAGAYTIALLRPSGARLPKEIFQNG